MEYLCYSFGVGQSSGCLWKGGPLIGEKKKAISLQQGFVYAKAAASSSWAEAKFSPFMTNPSSGANPDCDNKDESDSRLSLTRGISLLFLRRRTKLWMVLERGTSYRRKEKAISLLQCFVYGKAAASSSWTEAKFSPL
ncbi:hypothetical protein CEXT_797421 [Caerostris extrusa]|uniref:Uncharacterized protein n=1 Tax=Caerostris extrusa TaxID=172846 RepID=A0AAV4QBK2_CAEEX|nr:hypothetical protein CEXT_797421 [Caerostris extrusa]